MNTSVAVRRISKKKLKGRWDREIKLSVLLNRLKKLENVLIHYRRKF